MPFVPCREVPEHHRQLKRTKDELLEMPRQTKDFSDKQMEVRLPDSLASLAWQSASCTCHHCMRLISQGTLQFLLPGNLVVCARQAC